MDPRRRAVFLALIAIQALHVLHSVRERGIAGTAVAAAR
jgi:hypothetical protein